MHPVIHEGITLLWFVLVALWLVSWISVKRTVRRQSWSSRVLQGSLVAGGYVMMFNHTLRLGPLDGKFAPDSAGLEWSGLIVTAAEIALAIWARITIGRNWSSTVTVKEDHQLVRCAPYTLVRHPIYSGLLLASLGTAAAGREYRSLVGLVLVFIGFWVKLRLEERFMTEQFGSEYTRYKQEVKALIPYLL
ncbi:MAG TPA: isoprenylcysteine carboxylmethyltransferase family protein [Terriglobia bacterium]|nr:isoprenylcysteine carboxylmethyltransferase family protein [Terriglobia bacterium]